MTAIIESLAPQILEAVKKADSILLHCHPSPDQDSIGSVLAMKYALDQFGKKVTVIKGDSPLPKAFSHLPGTDSLIAKSFGELDLSDFDLFISLDSSSPVMVSRINTPVFPLAIQTIVIDHHSTNEKYGNINLVESSYPATAEIVFDLFKIWKVDFTHDISVNLFMGMYSDTGGFKYYGTTHNTLKKASELAEKAPDFIRYISLSENSRTKEALIFNGLALSSMKTFFDGKIGIASVSFEQISTNKITQEDISSIPVANIIISVSEIEAGISISEYEPRKLRIQFRSKDALKFDVSKLAVALGGGGHKLASGTRLEMSPEEAVKKVVETSKMIYNL